MKRCIFLNMFLSPQLLCANKSNYGCLEQRIADDLLFIIDKGLAATIQIGGYPLGWLTWSLVAQISPHST